MLNKQNKQRGVTLVEAMIALLVISVGLLGIASLQITAMNQNASAMNHSLAVWYAYNMSDRIRANPTAFNSYNGIDTDTGYSQSCTGGPCSDVQMAEADAADWATMVDRLPNGRGMVNANVDGLVVTVMWDDDGTGAGGTDCSGNTAIDLTCYRLSVAQPTLVGP